MWGRMSPCEITIWLNSGRSRSGRKPRARSHATGTRSGCRHLGWIRIISAVFADGSRRISLHVVSLAGGSVDVSTPVPRSRLYGRRTLLPPIDLQLPKLAEKDLIPATLQSMWVATQEYPASLPLLASQSVCLDFGCYIVRGLGGEQQRCSLR